MLSSCSLVDEIPKPDLERAFHYKLFSILEEERNFDVIAWDQDGQKFAIKNAERLAEEILSKYFCHKKFASFVRQLNLYGFKSTRCQDGERGYFHPLFQRGNKNLLVNMKRNKIKHSKSRIEFVKQPIESSSRPGGNIAVLIQQLASANRMIIQLKFENRHLRREIIRIDYLNTEFPFNYAEYETQYMGPKESQTSKRFPLEVNREFDPTSLYGRTNNELNDDINPLPLELDNYFEMIFKNPTN